MLTERLALSLFYQGIVIAGFGFLGQTWLLQRYLPSGVTALQLTTPFFAVLAGVILLDETIGLELLVGTILVVLGQLIARRQELSRMLERSESS